MPDPDPEDAEAWSGIVVSSASCSSPNADFSAPANDPLGEFSFEAKNGLYDFGFSPSAPTAAPEAEVVFVALFPVVLADIADGCDVGTAAVSYDGGNSPPSRRFDVAAGAGEGRAAAAAAANAAASTCCGVRAGEDVGGGP